MPELFSLAFGVSAGHGSAANQQKHRDIDRFPTSLHGNLGLLHDRRWEFPRTNLASKEANFGVKASSWGRISDSG
jgi:hypothetical protein